MQNTHQPPLPRQKNTSARTDDQQEAQAQGRRHVIYVVDDERLITFTLCAVLNGAGYEALAFRSAEDALQALPDRVPHLVLSDVMLGSSTELTGIELQKVLYAVAPEIPVVLMSGHSGTPLLVEAAHKRGEWVAVYSKPIKPERLLKIIAVLLDPDRATGAAL